MNCCNIIEITDKILGIIISLVSIFGVIVGVSMAYSYISKIKEKKYEAIFNFYSRLHMYLLEIKSKLGSPDKTVLLRKYEQKCLEKITNITIPDEKETKSFIKFVNDFITFIKDTDNQIPLSSVILKNYNDLKKYLMSSTLLGKDTPYSEYKENYYVKNEHERILSKINMLIEKIESKQYKIVAKIEEKQDKRDFKNLRSR